MHARWLALVLAPKSILLEEHLPPDERGGEENQEDPAIVVHGPVSLYHLAKTAALRRDTDDVTLVFDASSGHGRVRTQSGGWTLGSRAPGAARIAPANAAERGRRQGQDGRRSSSIEHTAGMRRREKRMSTMLPGRRVSVPEPRWSQRDVRVPRGRARTERRRLPLAQLRALRRQDVRVLELQPVQRTGSRNTAVGFRRARGHARAASTAARTRAK